MSGLAGPSLWHDEALEFGRAGGDLRAVVLGRPIDQDPPLWPMLLRLWIGLGADEWWLRAPSALVGAGSVYLVGAWAARRFGARTGVVAALWLALSPVQIHYAQEVNQYAPMVWLAAAMWIAWEGILRRRSAAAWWRFTGVCAAALGTHYGLAFPWLAIEIYLVGRLWRAGSGADRRGVAWHGAACAAVVAALLAAGLAERVATPHLQRRWGGTHPIKELDHVADAAWREILVFFTLPFSGGPAVWAAGALALLAAVGAVDLWRSGAAGRRLVAVPLLGGLALAYPADGLGWYPLGHRWALHATPAFAVALAAGLARPWRQVPALGRAIGAAAIALALLFAPRADAWNPWLGVPREEMRPVALYVLANATPGDAVYVYHAAEPAFRYYAGRSGRSRAIVWGRPPGRQGMAPEVARVRPGAGGGGRVWLVLARVQGDDTRALLRALRERGWSIRGDVRVPGARAVLMAR